MYQSYKFDYKFPGLYTFYTFYLWVHKMVTIFESSEEDNKGNKPALSIP